MAVGTTLGTLRMKVVTTFYRRLVLFERWTDPATPPTAPPEGYDCRQLAAEDFDDLERIRPRASRVMVEQRRARGDVCMGVWHGDQLVHTAWFASGPGSGRVDYLESCLSLSENDVYVYDTFTVRARRGEGIARLRDAYTRVHFASAGTPRTVTLVAPENLAGAKTIAQADYRPLGTYRLMRIGPLRRVLDPVGAAGALQPLRPCAGARSQGH